MSKKVDISEAISKGPKVLLRNDKPEEVFALAGPVTEKVFACIAWEDDFDGKKLFAAIKAQDPRAENAKAIFLSDMDAADAPNFQAEMESVPRGHWVLVTKHAATVYYRADRAAKKYGRRRQQLEKAEPELSGAYVREIATIGEVTIWPLPENCRKA